MNHTIQGGNLPVVIITLEPNETLVTERGGMAWMTPNLEMDTNMKGGVLKSLGRAVSGDSIFLNKYTNTSKTSGIIACSSSFPGEIFAKELGFGESIIAQKRSFLCAQEKVEISIHLRQKLSVGLFGGEGFILQKFQGPGWVFLEIDGAPIRYTLEPDQKLIVDPGHIAIYSPTISIDIKTIKGLKNIALGGEGLFIATVTGPGDLYLQSLTVANMAKSLRPYIVTGNS